VVLDGSGEMDGESGMRRWWRPLEGAVTMSTQVEEILKTFPEVRMVYCTTGRPEIANDVMGVHQTDVWTMLKPQSEWRPGLTRDALIEQAGLHPDWHGPLVQRPVLNPRAVEALSGLVAMQLVDVLAQRADLDPITSAELRRRVAARLLPGAVAASLAGAPARRKAGCSRRGCRRASGYAR